MKAYYYYYRDSDRRPVITVCLLKIADGLHRGISICSPKDNPCKKEGRKLALYKALRAAKKQKNGCRIKRTEARHVLSKANAGFLLGLPKSSYHTEPMGLLEEKIILGGKTNNEI